MLYNNTKWCSNKTSLADRSILFIPVPPFKQSDLLEDPEQNNEKNILKCRIKNKFVVNILIVIVSTLQFLIKNEVVPFIQPDLW